MKKLKKRRKGNYQGLGFVELMISIGVAGIALMVLMNMAANSMKEVIRYERHDALTRLAMDGALIVRRHVEKVNISEGEDEIFPDQPGDCYRIDFGKDLEDSSLEDSSIDFSESYSKNRLLEETDLYTTIIYNHENELGDVYYVAYCIESIDGSIYIGKVMTGYVECRNCGIEPYVHNIIVNVRQRV